MNKVIGLVLALGALGGVGCSASSEGNISLTWTILVGGQPSTCQAVGAVTLEVISTRSSGKEYRDLFDCADLSGTTSDVPTGTYTVEINLLDGQNRALNLVDVIETGVQVREDQTTSLGNFPFGFSGSGKANVQIKFGALPGTPGDNCDPTNPDEGAGVALQEIRITSGSQCMAYNITGVTDMNNAPTTAQTCQPFVCQPQTTVHTVNGLADGNYSIRVFGYKGATSAQNAPLCYSSDPLPFTISGGNTVNLGRITAPFNPDSANQSLCNATKPTA